MGPGEHPSSEMSAGSLNIGMLHFSGSPQLDLEDRGLLSQHPEWKGASPHLETATPLSSPFLCKQYRVTSVQPVTLLSPATRRPGGRPEVTRHCSLGEKPVPSRPVWQPSLLQWAGCAECPGGEVIPAPPQSVLSGTGIPGPVQTPCWAPQLRSPDKQVQETPSSEAPAPRLGAPPRVGGRGGNVPSFFREHITASFSWHLRNIPPCQGLC
ncbi:uncharacterized protein LOC118994955 [Sturnira hondurensis]|uniref:uncharacterized protein LOC118994955 n=1 Tax=Sturnira hondurensis TaxID=192404 RepID=UPI00187ADFA2|nr:uncharacterized protein LOC118994955 [Sturnira hondurensis]